MEKKTIDFCKNSDGIEGVATPIFLNRQYEVFMNMEKL